MWRAERLARAPTKLLNYRSKPLDGPGSNTESTTIGEPTVSMNKIKVVGARRIWGTLKSSSAKIDRQKCDFASL